MKISLLVNMKMPTIVGIFIFSRENFILCHLPEKWRKQVIKLANERKERNRKRRPAKVTERAKTDERAYPLPTPAERDQFMYLCLVIYGT